MAAFRKPTQRRFDIRVQNSHGVKQAFGVTYSQAYEILLFETSCSPRAAMLNLAQATVGPVNVNGPHGSDWYVEAID